jgi:hypothetical protein
MCRLFLGYNSADRTSVVAVQKLLQARGISTFLDRDKLVPGLPCLPRLEQALRDVGAVAVFIGRELGGWQKREMWLALDRQVQEEKQGRAFPVIPVLLPNADLTPDFTLKRDLVAVIGPSGGGKSSLVQAGLIPRLRRQRPPAITWDALPNTRRAVIASGENALLIHRRKHRGLDNSGVALESSSSSEKAVRPAKKAASSSRNTCNPR